MSPEIARALRRAGIVGAALTATLIGHVLTAGDMGILPVAPVLWLGLVTTVILPGTLSRGLSAFRAWEPLRIFAALVLAQAALHLVLHGAPWALGLRADHHAEAPLVSASVVGIHLGLALVLLVALCFGQRILVAAMAVVRHLLGGTRPHPLPRPGLIVAQADGPAGSQCRGRSWHSRGPPSAATPPTPSARLRVAPTGGAI